MPVLHRLPLQNLYPKFENPLLMVLILVTITSTLYSDCLSEPASVLLQVVSGPTSSELMSRNAKPTHSVGHLHPFFPSNSTNNSTQSRSSNRDPKPTKVSGLLALLNHTKSKHNLTRTRSRNWGPKPTHFYDLLPQHPSKLRPSKAKNNLPPSRSGDRSLILRPHPSEIGLKTKMLTGDVPASKSKTAEREHKLHSATPRLHVPPSYISGADRRKVIRYRGHRPSEPSS
jgi:hypothetical protein